MGEVHLLGGCGSSGTTLLAWLIDGLHDLRSGPESGLFHHRQLYSVDDFSAHLEACLAHQAPSLSLGVNQLQVPLIPRIFFMDRAFYGLAPPHGEAHILGSATSMDSLVQLVHTEMGRAQSIHSSFAFVDQTPKNCIASREFLQWRPNARFIHLLRDGRDVMLSLARRWALEAKGHPPGTYLGAAAARWTYDVHQARRASELPGYLEIRYEDLVRAPLATINQVLDHLGRSPTDQSTLDQHRSPSAEAAGERFHGGGKKSWGAQPGQAIQTDGVGRWKRQLEPALVDKMMDFRFKVPRDSHAYGFGQMLEATGYA